jgi:hypothetical protein
VPGARSFLSQEQELSLPAVTATIQELMQSTEQQQQLDTLRGLLPSEGEEDDDEGQSIAEEMYLNLHGNLEHGRKGEFIAFLYLSALFPASQGNQVRWLNRHAENYRPYDLIVTTPAQQIHVEVKTRSLRDSREEEGIKQWIISPNEIRQALLDAQAIPPRLYCCLLIALSSDGSNVQTIRPVGFKEGGLLGSVDQQASSFLIQIN